MKGNFLGGIIFLLLGAFLIISNFFNIEFSWNYIWPIFILLPGLNFELDYYFKRKNAGVLVPGGLLTTIGILFYLCAFFGYNILDFLWPTFILAPAIGIFQLFLATKKRSLIVPVFILGGLSLIFYIEELIEINVWSYIFGFGLIILGFITILLGRKSK
ncbi:MAG: hypothetical protein H0Z22_07855 [Thermosipho sp. (in: Bacteria)]|nr:hypothetical protein [Thermosipho sp. (in: thermotogales)]